MTDIRSLRLAAALFDVPLTHVVQESSGATTYVLCAVIVTEKVVARYTHRRIDDGFEVTIKGPRI